VGTRPCGGPEPAVKRLDAAIMAVAWDDPKGPEVLWDGECRFVRSQCEHTRLEERETQPSITAY
jgi:hypothetical protein